MELTDVICPTCYERFGVVAPAPEELPAEMDYDCEICCRPMVIAYAESADGIIGEARSLIE